MRILIIANVIKYQELAKISPNRYNFLEYLVKTSNDQIKLINVSQPNSLSLILDKINWRPDLIMYSVIGPGAGPIQQQILLRDLKEANIPKCLWIEDFQYVKFFEILIRHFDFDGILLQTNHKKITNFYLELCPIVMNFENFIDSRIFRNYEEPKVYDVLLYGYLDDCYPFRTRLYNLLKENLCQMRIKIIEHPGYRDLTDEAITQEKLARLISSSWLTICTSSQYDMFLKKYLEAIFCGSLVLGNLPSDYENLLKPHVIEINEIMSDQVILNTIKSVLANREKMGIQSKEAMNTFRTKFAYPAGSYYFSQLCQTMHQSIQQRKCINHPELKVISHKNIE